jgi:hypothetical protein
MLGSSECQEEGLWKGSFAGHLVALVPDRRLLIDASIDQVNCPADGITIPCPFIAEFPEGFTARSHRVPALFVVNGCFLGYHTETMPKRVLESRDWNCKPERVSIIRSICEQIDNAMPVRPKEFARRVHKAVKPRR